MTPQNMTPQVCLDHVSAEIVPGTKYFEGRRVASGHVARALTILVDAWLPLKWAHDITMALHMRADRKLDMAAAQIQNLVRIAAARVRATIKKRARDQHLRARLEQSAALTIQRRLARGPTARAAVALLATRAFRKYVVDRHEILQYAASARDENEMLDTGKNLIYYWAFVGLGGSSPARGRTKRGDFNFHAKIGAHVSWVKPKLLRDKDMMRVSQRPTRRTAFVVDCAFCGVAAAEKVCLDSCADPYIPCVWR